MPNVPLTQALRREYESLFDTCMIRGERSQEAEAIAKRILTGRSRYQTVGGSMGIPWFFVGAVHALEAGLNFQAHLHNGDPLTARTRQVPAGRPKSGEPPFPWEDSARDALSLKSLGAGTDWSLAGILYQLERYNGFGYRLYHPHVYSPYLWAGSNHYTSGKYVADGTWSESAASKQCGAAVLLRRLAELEEVTFPDRPAPTGDAPPVVFSSKAPRDPDSVARIKGLQQWLNTFPEIFVKVDGAPGLRTSEAMRKVTGSYLPGDPRE